MLAFLLVSSVVTPPIMWLLLYTHIVDQYKYDEDGWPVLVETKAEAQKDVRHRMLRSWKFWVYSVYDICMISFFIYSMSV